MRFGFLLFLALTTLRGGGCPWVSSSTSAATVPGSGSEVIAMKEQVDPPMKRNATDRPPANQAAKDLHAYYENEKNEPAWQDAIRRLSAADANQRTQAASYLNELLDQALKDELAGADPRQPSPFWGEGPTSKARMFRHSVADALAKADPTPGVLPVVRWFLEHEKVTDLQGEALKAVTRLQGPKADALLVDAATKPHSNADVALTAMRLVGERNIKVTAEQLAPLCQHHRSKLREAARALNAKLGFPAPPPFDSARAIRSEPIRRLMDEIGGLVDEPVPANAPFVCVMTTTSYPPEMLERSSTEGVRGWLVSEDEKQWVVLLVNRFRSSFRKKGEKNVTVALTRVALQEEVDRVVALRREGGGGILMSTRGGASGYYLGPAASPYESLLAQWLYSGKRYDLAAAVLFPALDTLTMDSHLLDITRISLGDWYGQDMLVAFVGERDYAKTERLAKRIADRFPGTPYHGYAVRLLDELPRRREDFKTFRLPSPAEWAAQKKGMSRREQIDFLCRRLRLLNCFQGGQPGGPMYDGPQYAEPCGITSNAAWGLNQGKTQIINPLVELVGPLYARQQAPPTEGLQVTVDDVPALAAHLREDWYQLTVSFWRDFAPGRTLERTRPLLVFLINRIAGHTICDARKLDAMTDKQRDAEISRLSKWAEENRGKDETALLLKTLEDALNSGTPWIRVNHQVARLAELKAKAAVPLLFRFVESGLAEPRQIPEIRRWCDNIAPGALQEVARKALEHADETVRKRVALLDLDKDEAALLLWDLEKELNSTGPSFFLMGNRADRLAELKVKAAVPLLFRFVEAGRVQNPFELNHIAQVCAKIDPDAFDILIKKALKGNDQKVQMRVALLALGTKNREDALAVLGDGLEHGTVLLAETFSALNYHFHVDRDKVAVRKMAVRVFKNPQLLTADSNERSRIVSAATYAGLADGLRLYLRLLDTPGNTIEGKTYDRPVAEVTAEELITFFAAHDDAVAQLQKSQHRRKKRSSRSRHG